MEIVFNIFLITLTAVYCLMMIFYMMKWLGEKEFVGEQKQFKTKVSIIIAARNEEQNIAACLQSIFIQDYPKDLFEVILVDDSSEDGTLAVANRFKAANKFSNLMILSLAENNSPSPKKRAITEGIKNSLGDLIITTDADTTRGERWLSSIVSFYEAKKVKLIACPVLISEDKSVFEKIQSLEISGLMLMTGASFFASKPLMCNGANLAFEKKAFEEVNGYTGPGEHLASGDDVMLMQKIRAKYRNEVVFLKSSSAMVFTKAQPTLSGFFSQRKRWASKISSMKDGFATATGMLVYLMNFSIVITAASFIFSDKFVFPFIICLSAKCVVDFLFLFLSVSFSTRGNLLWLFIPAEIFQTVYIIISALFLNGKYEWKNRKLK